ncbi:MAG TPA: phosphotransferase [Steroidobacteraceae bacterium]|nr:phosphotransferase [Steroidobacteraceae bacterium]
MPHAADRVYVQSVIDALRQMLRDSPDGLTDTLRNCIRVLAVLDSSWDCAPGRPAPAALTHANRFSRFRPCGPPESAAVRPATVDAVGRAATAIESLSAGTGPAIEQILPVLAWETDLAQEAIQAMNALEVGSAAGVPGADGSWSLEAAQHALRTGTGNEQLTVTSFHPIPGGRSRLSALLHVKNAPGLGPDLVIQIALPGIAQFTGPECQFNLLKVVRAHGLKVPKPVLFQEYGAGRSGSFLVTERIEGAVAERDYFSPIRSAALARGLAGQMALLHRIPIAAFDGIVSRPSRPMDRAALLQELDSFAQCWRRYAHAPSVAMSTALAWLREAVSVVQHRECAVHNDMVFHNVLARDDAITAVLDWEQCAIGHPAADLGYAYPFIAPHTSWTDFLEEYLRCGGLRMPQAEIDYFAIRALVRIFMLSMERGRVGFESGPGHGVFRATVGAYFLQRLMLRLGKTLQDVLSRA